MARVIVAERAKYDVRRLLFDLNERAGFRVAARYAAEFKETYCRLAQFPASGAPRPALGPNARFAIVLPYLVI
jgi:toxin ParE1/3/4